jgi:CBS domain-containing protein
MVHHRLRDFFHEAPAFISALQKNALTNSLLTSYDCGGSSAQQYKGWSRLMKRLTFSSAFLSTGQESRGCAMSLQEILNRKGSRVFNISPHATLAEVVQKLVKNNCGSLVVCQQEDCTHMLGIITERDILRACAAHKVPLENYRVSDVMTSDLATCSPGDSVQDAMGVMTERRIRHLPVIDDEGKLIGIVSIGDLVKQQHDQLTMENHYLKSYIQS